MRFRAKGGQLLLMKVSICAALHILFLCSFALCQNDMDRSRVNRLEATVKSGVKDDSLRLIIEAGESGDKSVIPYLEKLASQPSERLVLHSIESYAQVALAKLGSESHLTLILRQVDDENIFVQDVGMKKLAMVGGRTAFLTFLRLLDDLDYRREKPSKVEAEKAVGAGRPQSRRGDEVLDPRSYLAMRLLAEICPNPPVTKSTPLSPETAQLWKVWFESNKQLLEP
jgi:HEAT repeat protein